MTRHIPSSDLSAADVPTGALSEFADSFDGYRHFGEHHIERANAIRSRWEDAGELPEDVDDLRACLFIEFRRERFLELDDVMTVTAPDGTIIHEPDPSTETAARSEHERYKRVLADRIADMLRRRDGYTEVMDSAAIRECLQGAIVETHSDRALSISSTVIRADLDGVPIVAVGNEQRVDVQINGLLDALHFWRIRFHGRGPLRYVIGRRADSDQMADVLAALGSLRAALPSDLDLSLEVDFEPVLLSPENFAGSGSGWLLALQDRDKLLDALPPSRRACRSASAIRCSAGTRASGLPTCRDVSTDSRSAHSLTRAMGGSASALTVATRTASSDSGSEPPLLAGTSSSSANLRTNCTRRPGSSCGSSRTGARDLSARSSRSTASRPRSCVTRSRFA